VNYSDHLPRRVMGKSRCQHLDEDGKRCMNMARFEVTVHENPEHRDNWYNIFLCDEHTADWDKEEAKKSHV
jgi:hypothetical protein